MSVQENPPEMMGSIHNQLPASQLLGGSKNRDMVQSQKTSAQTSESPGLDSGVLEIIGGEFPDDTTSVEETQMKKSKRMPRRCKWCDNFSRGSTNLCAKHGGGRRCHCGKLARGPSNLCMKHGGGRRCTIANCQSASVYKSDFCRAHGGGKRCSVEGCVSSVYSIYEDICFKHGGGQRCHFEGCKKAPVGTTDFCIRHGGGRRCSIAGCGKGAVCEGMCVKHHQDAYKTDQPQSLGMVTTSAITIADV